MSEDAPTTTDDLRALEQALLEIGDVKDVIRIEAFEVAPDTMLVAAKLSVAQELTMPRVSIVVALAERRVRSAVPNAKHVYITPDVHVDQTNVPSTSAIVTLSYD